MNWYVHKVMPTIMLSVVLTLVGCTSSTSSVDVASKATPSPSVVQMWLTTQDRQDKLTAQAPITLQNGPASPAIGTLITVDPTQHFQRITGFGAALTDSSAYLLGQLSPQQQKAAMQALFDPQQGIGLSEVRIPMGASDYTATPPDNPSPYSYDDLAPGRTDPSLAHFSIAHDRTYTLPLLIEAKRINPQITTIAAPWSPPAWMKTNDSMVSGSIRSDSYNALAQYFVHFLQQYHSAGVSIDEITPQNEPGEINHGYPSLDMSGSQEASFITQYLGPALAKAGLDTKIFGWDNEWLYYQQAEDLLSNASARSYLSGVAWHCYGGDPAVMDKVHTAYPSLEQEETECSTGPHGIAPLSTFEVALQSIQHWASSALLWNIALDPSGGPKIGQGCAQCVGLMTVDAKQNTAQLTDEAIQFGHFSKFVHPGALHIAATSTNNNGIENVAFENPDKTLAMVVRNSSSQVQTIIVQTSNKTSFTSILPAGAIATYTWP
ncbi:MAG TPA: glycoside hydrolase family 30 beta sandwich domain-containing protein [Ktedonobacteraceae bacterium]